MPSPAGKWNQHLHKACQQKEAWSALKCPGRWLRWLQKTQWANTSRWHHHWLWNFTLDFKQHGYCASPLFLLTLGPWFPNEMQNLLSSEKRTLDHWATVQFFFFLVQVRCFCHLFLQCGDKWRWTGIAHWVRSGEHTGSHMCSQEKCKNWDLYRSRWGITHGPGCVRPGLSMLGPGGPVSCRV